MHLTGFRRQHSSSCVSQCSYRPRFQRLLVAFDQAGTALGLPGVGILRGSVGRVQTQTLAAVVAVCLVARALDREGIGSGIWKHSMRRESLTQRVFVRRSKMVATAAVLLR